MLFSSVRGEGGLFFPFHPIRDAVPVAESLEGVGGGVYVSEHAPTVRAYLRCSTHVKSPPLRYYYIIIVVVVIITIIAVLL